MVNYKPRPTIHFQTGPASGIIEDIPNLSNPIAKDLFIDLASGTTVLSMHDTLTNDNYKTPAGRWFRIINITIMQTSGATGTVTFDKDNLIDTSGDLLITLPTVLLGSLSSSYWIPRASDNSNVLSSNRYLNVGASTNNVGIVKVQGIEFDNV